MKDITNYEQVLQRICNLLKEKNLQQKDLCDALNLSNKTFTSWKSGLNSSYMKKLPEIANYLDTSVNYLLGIEQKEKAPGGLTEGEELLLELFRRVPEEKQELVLQMIRVALSNL